MAVLYCAALFAALLHVASGQTCLAGSGTKILARTANKACPAGADGSEKIVMAGFTATTDLTFNGIYNRVDKNLMQCRNTATSGAGVLTDGAGNVNAACAPYCQNNGAGFKDMCIGEGGKQWQPYGLGEIYYNDHADGTDASSSLIFLSWMDQSPYPGVGGAGGMPGSGGVWWACKYTKTNFIKALNYGYKCSADSDCRGTNSFPTGCTDCECKFEQDGAVCKTGMMSYGMYFKVLPEYGLNTGTLNMLEKCTAMAFATDDNELPEAGGAGWKKYGKGTPPYVQQYSTPPCSEADEAMGMCKSTGCYGKCDCKSDETCNTMSMSCIGITDDPYAPAPSPAPGGGGSVPSGMSCTYDSECMTSGDTCQAMICTGGTVNIGGACNAPEECAGAANCEYDMTTSTQKCKACPGPGECNNMAFVNPGEINCGILLEKSLKATVNDLVGGQNLETETAVSVGCPGNGCEVCPNGEYSAFTDITCLECPPGTSGRGVDGAVSLDDGCPACPESTIQPLSGQDSCTECPGGAGSSDGVECSCRTGYGRKCSGSATEARVTGLPEGDGLYTLDSTITHPGFPAKPVYKATVYTGTESSDYFMAYNLTFQEWQIYKMEKSMCMDSKGCGVLKKGEGNCTDASGACPGGVYSQKTENGITTAIPHLIPGPKTENGITTLTQIVDEVSCLPLDAPTNPSRCNQPVFVKKYLFFYYGRLVDTPFPPSGKWLYQQDPKKLAITIDNVVVTCNQFQCDQCSADFFNQLPSREGCQQCPINMDTRGEKGMGNRFDCQCSLGYVGACSDDMQVDGHSNAFFNGIYRKTAPTDTTLKTKYAHKNFYKGEYFSLYYGADQVQAKDKCAEGVGRWYFGEIKMGQQPACENCFVRTKSVATSDAASGCEGDVAKTGKDATLKCPIKYDSKYKFVQQCNEPLQSYIVADRAVISDRSAATRKCMTQTQSKYMQYTLMSKCTDSATPPSGPGWKDFRTSVKLNLLTADCRADTACELCTGGKFSDKEQTVCEQCPDGGDCRDGQLFIRDEFWIAPNATLNNETKLYKCIHTGACIGNPDFAANFSCKKGTEGRLCGICSPNYFMAAGMCMPCGGGDGGEEGTEAIRSGLFALAGCFLFFGAVAGIVVGRKFNTQTDPVSGKTKPAKGKSSAERQKQAALAEAAQRTAGGGGGGGGGGGNKILIASNQGSSMGEMIPTGGGMDEETSEDIAAAAEQGAEAAEQGAEAAEKAGEVAAEVAAQGAAQGAAAGKDIAKAGKAAALKATKSWNQSSMEMPKANLNLSMCDGLTEKLKIFAAFCQVANLFYESLTITWPVEIQGLFKSMSYINFDLFQIFSVGCVSGTFYYSFMAIMAIPPMIIVFFAWVWLCGTVCITAPIVKRVWTGQVLHKVSLCLFMVYPTISKTVLQMWAYSEVIEGRQYLMVDLRLSPSDDNYPYWFSVAFVFFCGYVLGIPLFFAYMLFRNNEILGENKAEQFEAEHLHDKDTAEIKRKEEKYAQDQLFHREDPDSEMPEFKATPRPQTVFSWYHQAAKQSVRLCVDDQMTKFSLMDRNMYVKVKLEEVDGKLQLRHKITKELIPVEWVDSKDGRPTATEEDMEHNYLVTAVQQQALKDEDLIDGVVKVAEMTDEGEFSGKVFWFKNPELEKSIMVKCVILYGSKYRPLQWLSDPRDNEMWTDGEFSEVIKVSHGEGYRLDTARDGREHFISETPVKAWNAEDWTVELDNGASFLNMKQGRDYPRPSAAILSLAWLGQAYEAEFWFWEMIEFTRKLTLSAVVVFVAPGTSVQILCAIFVCVIFLGLVAFYKPYEADDDDTFSFCSFICLVFILVLGLGSKVSTLEGDSANPAMTTIITLLMIVTAFTMIIMLGMVLIEKCCGLKPSMITKKCKQCCHSKRAVDASQFESDHQADAEEGINGKSNQVVPMNMQLAYKGEDEETRREAECDI